jgi:serine/threonine protein phosphatase PrpC
LLIGHLRWAPVFGFDFAGKVDAGLLRDRARHVARIQRGQRLAIVGADQEEISTLVAEKAAIALEAQLEMLGGATASLLDARERTYVALSRIGKEFKISTDSPPGTRTQVSMVSLTFTEAHAVIGRIGEGACWRLRGQELTAVSWDSNLQRNRRYDSRERPIESNRFSVGEIDGSIDVHHVPFEVGDVFLLCSQGVRCTLPPSAIAEALIGARTAQAACERILRFSWQIGGLTDLAVAAARVFSEELHLDKPPRTEIEQEDSSTRDLMREDG